MNFRELLDKAKQIGEGVWNTHFDIKVAVENIAAKRLAICRECPYNSKNKKKPGTEKCLQCGCVLRWKTHSLSSECPIGKWTAVIGVDEELSDQIDKITGND